MGFFKARASGFKLWPEKSIPLPELPDCIKEMKEAEVWPPENHKAILRAQINDPGVPFGSVAKCPKCTRSRDRFYVTFYDKRNEAKWNWRPCEDIAVPAYLLVKCPCEYRWREQPADAAVK